MYINVLHIELLVITQKTIYITKYHTVHIKF